MRATFSHKGRREVSGALCPHRLLAPGQVHRAGAAGRMRGQILGGNIVGGDGSPSAPAPSRPAPARECNSAPAPASVRSRRRSCPCARHSPRPGRARSCRRRNRSFRDGRNKAPTPTSPATSQSSRSASRRPCSPHRAGGTASPSRCDRAARDSRAPGGCRHIVRGSVDRGQAPRPARSPRIPCGRADASARQKPPPDDRPAPCTGSRSNRHWRS